MPNLDSNSLVCPHFPYFHVRGIESGRPTPQRNYDTACMCCYPANASPSITRVCFEFFLVNPLLLTFHRSSFTARIIHLSVTITQAPFTRYFFDVSNSSKMSDPYGAYDEYEDVDDMSLDDIDFIALQQAEKNSLEVSSFLRSLQTSEASSLNPHHGSSQSLDNQLLYADYMPSRPSRRSMTTVRRPSTLLRPPCWPPSPRKRSRKTSAGGNESCMGLPPLPRYVALSTLTPTM